MRRKGREKTREREELDENGGLRFQPPLSSTVHIFNFFNGHLQLPLVLGTMDKNLVVVYFKKKMKMELMGPS